MAHPYDDLVAVFPDFGRMAAFIRQVGGQKVVEGVLSGDLTFERVGKTVQIKEAVRPLFDKNGRRIPPRDLAANVCDPDRSFHLIQPAIDYGARLDRLTQFFPQGTKFASAAEFKDKSESLLELIRQNEQIANISIGVGLPICLPRMTMPDYGQALGEIFVPAVAAAYKAQFPKWSFTNYRVGELQQQVTIVPGTRHEHLPARMAEGPVVGRYFPNPLQGYSVHAQREQMSTLAESFLLAGGLDTAVAWVMYPDVMARDFKTPGYDCSALQWQSSGVSLCFGARGDGAGFGRWGDLALAVGRYSGGLLFIG